MAAEGCSGNLIIPSDSPTGSGVTFSAPASGSASASAPSETIAAGVEVCFAAQSHQNELVRCKGLILKISGDTASVATAAYQLAGPNDIKLLYIDRSHSTPRFAGLLIEFVVVRLRVQHLLPASTSGHWESVIGLTGADHIELWKTWLAAKIPYQSAAEEAAPQQSKQQPNILPQNLAGGGIEDLDASSDSNSDSDLNPIQAKRPKTSQPNPFVQVSRRVFWGSSSGRRIAGLTEASPVPQQPVNVTSQGPSRVPTELGAPSQTPAPERNLSWTEQLLARVAYGPPQTGMASSSAHPPANLSQGAAVKGDMPNLPPSGPASLYQALADFNILPQLDQTQGVPPPKKIAAFREAQLDLERAHKAARLSDTPDDDAMPGQ